MDIDVQTAGLNYLLRQSAQPDLIIHVGPSSIANDHNVGIPGGRVRPARVSQHLGSHTSIVIHAPSFFQDMPVPSQNFSKYDVASYITETGCMRRARPALDRIRVVLQGAGRHSVANPLFGIVVDRASHRRVKRVTGYTSAMR